MRGLKFGLVGLCKWIFILLLFFSLQANAQLEKETTCKVALSVEPQSPQVINEGESLKVIVRAYYQGPKRLVSLFVLDLPSFATGWTGNQITCGDCFVADTVYLHPGLCDSGDYTFIFIGTADYERGLSDTLYYHLQVKDLNRPCKVDAGPDHTVNPGEQLYFPVLATDPDTICGKEITLSWSYWGYPFEHGAILEPGQWIRRFNWTPSPEDEGTHYVFFRVSDGESFSIDTVKITVLEGRTSCAEPWVLPEPEFTQGTSNTVHYLPACGAYEHEVCYFDYLFPDKIKGCRELRQKISLSQTDTLNAIFENLEDGHKYGYFVKAYFIESPDSTTYSQIVYSTQDASPPDSVNSTQAYADSGGVIIINWKGVEDKVSYVNRYEVYRKKDNYTYSLIEIIPATPDNDTTTPYGYMESLNSGTGLEEGRVYYYTVRAVDTVDNRGGGIETKGVVPDSTAPCVPKLTIPYDYRFVYTSYIKGVESKVWGKSNCPEVQKAHFIRFQAVRDSLKYFNSEWQPGYNFFETTWISYEDDSTLNKFILLPPNGDTSYVNGHRYFYRAQAKDSLGNTSNWTKVDSVAKYESAYQDVFPPDDISNLTVNPEIDSRDNSFFIRVNWDPAIDAVSGLKRYYIYRKIDEGIYQKIDSTTKTYFIDPCNDINERFSICYRIGSIDNVGNERDYLHTNWEACAKPSIGPFITLECDTTIYDECYTTKDSIAVFWKGYDNTGVEKYIIFGNGLIYYQNDPSQNYFRIPLPSDTVYKIKVQAIFSNGTKSTWSNEEAVIKDGTPPDPIELLIAQNDTSYKGDINLHWNRPFDATGIYKYEIFRKTPSSVFNSVATILDTFSTENIFWTDKYADSPDDTLIVYQYYIYQVHPIDLVKNVQRIGNAIDSAYCNKPPTIYSHSKNEGSITIFWEKALPSLASDWNDSVKVYKGNFSNLDTIDMVSRADSFVYYPKEDSTIYIFQVKEIPLDLSGNLFSALSKPYMVPFHTVPDTVKSFTLQPLPLLPEEANQAEGKIYLTWEYEKPPQVDSFYITRWCNSALDKTVRVSADIDTYMDSALWADSIYEYRIIAHDIFGQASEEVHRSAKIDPIWVFTPKINEFAPAYFNNDTLIVSWEWVDKNLNPVGNYFGAESCWVEASIFTDFDSAFSRQVKWIPAENKKVSIYIKDLVDVVNKTIYCRIKSKDKWEHESPWSSIYFGLPYAILDDIAPTPVSQLSVKAIADSSAENGIIDVYLNWVRSYDMGGGGLKYYIVYRDSANTGWEIDATVTDTFIVIENLKVANLQDSAYRFKVQPVDNLNNEQAKGNQIAYLIILNVPLLANPDSKQHIAWEYFGLADSFYAECSYDYYCLGTACMNRYMPEAAKVWVPWGTEEYYFKTDSTFINHDTIYFHIKAKRGTNESAWSKIMTYPPRADNPLDLSEQQHNRPTCFELYQNYPNPFNPETRISFSLPERSQVLLRVYNIKGELVKTLINSNLEPAYYSLLWDSRNEQGKLVSSGIYFYQIKTEKFSTTKKMILLR